MRLSTIGKDIKLSLRELIVFFSFALCGLSAASATERANIPISIDDDDRMQVWMTLNGEATVATIDTAATFAMVDQRLLNEENSTPLGKEVPVLGVGGSRLFPSSDIGPLMLGDLRFDILPAAVNGRSSFAGHKTILPADALPGQILDFDFPTGIVQTYSDRPERMGDHIVSKHDYQNIGGLPFITVKLNNTLGLALIDTGSEVSYVNTVFALRSGARIKPDREQELFGTGGTERGHINVLDVDKLVLGRHSKRKFEMLSADTPVLEHLGLEEEAVMVLGMDVLKHFRMQMDRGAKRIYLGRPEDSISSGRRFKFTPMSGRLMRHGEF